MGFLKHFVNLNAAFLLGGTTLTAYYYPELRKNPQQLGHAMHRGLRCAYTGVQMARDYYGQEVYTSEIHEKAATRMYDCFCKNGGPYIKIGQMIGQFQSLLPAEYITVFEPMLMQAPKTGYKDVKEIVELELGKPIEDVFSEFEEKPLASASLGQVHKARLRSTGEQVAVKVQHKWIKEQVPGDIRLIKMAANVAMYIFPDFKYKWLPEEFQNRLPLELDFRKEATNAERCASIFAKNPNVAVPSVYRSLTTERVLVMSFEKGIPLTNVKQMHDEGVDLRRSARIISEAFSEMIYKEGVVHSDPHPGNIFIRPKKINGKDDIEVVLLDHGIYTYLTEETRLSYTKLWRGILAQNEGKIREASKELGADFYELFAAMVVNRTFDDIMDKDKSMNTKSRLGVVEGDKKKADALKKYALVYHKDIVDILDMIKRELLLILKTNNYLRAIDKRLGHPNNTYNTINEVTWEVYSKEVAQPDRFQFYKEMLQYYLIKVVLGFQFMRIRFLHLFGIKASKEELQNFDLDYNL